jgi:hypothetical protein
VREAAAPGAAAAPSPSDRLTRRKPENNKDDPMKTVQKRILVTGGAGFLGSHLCERLSARGHDILCADNYFTGRKDNIAHLLQEPNFEAMRHDITFPLYVEVDEIYNLACPASPIHYQFDPVQTTKTSVIGAINMLGLRAGEGQDPAGLDFRGVWRPDTASAARNLPRQCQPDRAACLLRRRQALRRDVVLRLPSPAQGEDPCRADLQYLRPAHAPQ